MRFSQTPIAGLTVLDLDKRHDARGYFARSFDTQEFARQGLPEQFDQHGIAFNREAGTIRGLHYQLPPHAEAKLVRCTRGEVFDVAVDLRSDSATFAEWFGLHLSAEIGNALFIPPGFAHGYQSLVRESEVFYLMLGRYVEDAAGGVRYDDPSIGVKWPLEPTVISERDLQLPKLVRSPF